MQTFASTTKSLHTAGTKTARSIAERGAEHHDPVSTFTSPTIFRKAACACGGGCDSCQTQSNSLKVSQPDDPAEIEADQIADKVMRMPIRENAGNAENKDNSKQIAKTGDSPNTIHRKCDSCEDEEETIRRKPLPSSWGRIPSQSQGLGSLKGPVIAPGNGSPVPDSVRHRVESVLGADLSQVQVHNDSSTHKAAADISASAFTYKNHIHLGAGQSAEDLELMAHELTHTVQQTDSPSTCAMQTEPRLARKSKKPTSGRCGGWDCSSDCDKTDAGENPSSDESKNHSMTVLIDLDVAKATDISSAEDVGHTYVKFSESNGDKYTYGFYHNKSKNPDVIFNPEVPGCAAHPDKTHWHCVDMEVKFSLTATEYKDALDLARSWCKSPPKYHITDRNCTTFVAKVASAAGKTLPPHRSKAGYGTFSQQADNPNALFESYVSSSESETWGDLVDNYFTGHFTHEGTTTRFTDFELDINSTFGVVGEYEFKRSNGDKVEGKISGHIEFKVDGTTKTVRPFLYYRWTEVGGASGLGKLRVIDIGGVGMIGTWGWDNEDSGGGDWVLNKK